MTAGRGRPVVFDEPAQAELLRLVADGVRLGEAAAKVGVGRDTPGQLARRNRGFAAALADAKTIGRAVRFAPERLPHGVVSTYTNHGCRCRPCTAAATRARSNSPDRKHADIHHLPDPQPPTATTKFPVLADVG
ncbi:hypothetical protein Srufu_079240 (plasmid) [Streptomyces libani subsp. rufus]|nr:hypothetical protein Srufu_079240 [Streptomyces libani subsp. rufus]